MTPPMSRQSSAGTRSRSGASTPTTSVAPSVLRFEATRRGGGAAALVEPLAARLAALAEERRGGGGGP
jgi:hypothetical protein